MATCDRKRGTLKDYLQKQVDEYRRLYGDELPVEFLERFAVDRLKDPKFSLEESRATIDFHKKTIMKKGGIRTPVILECSGPRIERMGVDALLIEGNHTIIAAREMGLKTVPTRIV